VNLWAILMLVSSGLFAGGAAVFAWERVPVWRALSPAQFKPDFARAIHKADRVQPALLVVSVVAAVGFGVTTAGAARSLALMGAAGFIVILIASGVVLVPLQRRIIASSEPPPAAVEAMRRHWFSGHLGRSILAAASFILMALAAAM
jgi:hypothetical protein